jgi:hypothetical protein
MLVALVGRQIRFILGCIIYPRAVMYFLKDMPRFFINATTLHTTRYLSMLLCVRYDEEPLAAPCGIVDV